MILSLSRDMYIMYNKTEKIIIKRYVHDKRHLYRKMRACVAAINFIHSYERLSLPALWKCDIFPAI